MVLGCYESFPEIIHGLARFSFRISSKKVQRIIASIFHHLNQEKLSLSEIGFSFPGDCDVEFEIGVGKGADFIFFEKVEFGRIDETIKNEMLVYLDFLCALKYHTTDNHGKKTALKFDYYLMRSIFYENFVELLIYHDHGPRRVHVEDFLNFLIKRIENELANQHAVTIKPEIVHTV